MQIFCQILNWSRDLITKLLNMQYKKNKIKYVEIVIFKKFKFYSNLRFNPKAYINSRINCYSLILNIYIDRLILAKILALVKNPLKILFFLNQLNFEFLCPNKFQIFFKNILLTCYNFCYSLKFLLIQIILIIFSHFI